MSKMPYLADYDLKVLATNTGYSVEPRERVAAMAAELLQARDALKELIVHHGSFCRCDSIPVGIAHAMDIVLGRAGPLT